MRRDDTGIPSCSASFLTRLSGFNRGKGGGRKRTDIVAGRSEFSSGDTPRRRSSRYESSSAAARTERCFFFFFSLSTVIGGRVFQRPAARLARVRRESEIVCPYVFSTVHRPTVLRVRERELENRLVTGRMTCFPSHITWKCSLLPISSSKRTNINSFFILYYFQ